MNTKNKISKVLYWFAIFGSLVNFISIVWIHWSFILDGKGTGSFAVLWALLYGVITGAIWLIAFLIEKNKVLSMLYWATILAPVILFSVQPVSFYIE